MAHIVISNVPEELHQAAVELASALAGKLPDSGHTVAVKSETGAHLYGPVVQASPPVGPV